MANNFSADANCVALWRFESGALTADSKGTNTLTDANTVQEDTTNFKEGACAAFFDQANDEYFSITDGNLNAGFPLKNGDTSKVISLCFWMRVRTFQNGRNSIIYAKYESGKSSFKVQLIYNGTNTAFLRVVNGYNSGASEENIDHASTLTCNETVWYHVAVVFDGVNKTIFIKIQDVSGNTIGSNIDTTFTNETNVEDGRLVIGRQWGSTTTDYDGLLDEMVVFKDKVTESEINQIRAGTYGAAGGLSIPVAMYHYMNH